MYETNMLDTRQSERGHNVPLTAKSAATVCMYCWHHRLTPTTTTTAAATTIVPYRVPNRAGSNKLATNAHRSYGQVARATFATSRQQEEPTNARACL